MFLTLAEANRIAGTAISEARRSGIAISVSVCDATGRLVVHQRMDGVSLVEASRESMGKAIATIMLGHASGDPPIADSEYGRAAEVIGEGAPVINRPGGLPILRAGTLVGAIGVSGAATDEQDARYARAGLGE